LPGISFGKSQVEKPSWAGLRRWRGAALFVVGALAWVYGAAHSELTTGRGVVVLMVALYSLLIGSCWLIAGKKISELQ